MLRASHQKQQLDRKHCLPSKILIEDIETNLLSLLDSHRNELADQLLPSIEGGSVEGPVILSPVESRLQTSRGGLS